MCDPVIMYITPPYYRNTLGQPEFVIGFLKPGKNGNESVPFRFSRLA